MSFLSIKEYIQIQGTMILAHFQGSLLYLFPFTLFLPALPLK